MAWYARKMNDIASIRKMRPLSPFGSWAETVFAGATFGASAGVVCAPVVAVSVPDLRFAVDCLEGVNEFKFNSG